MRHRIVEAGQASNDVLAAVTIFAGLAILPLALGLSLDLFVTLERIYGPAPGLFAGGAFFVLAVFFGTSSNCSCEGTGKWHSWKPKSPRRSRPRWSNS